MLPKHATSITPLNTAIYINTDPNHSRMLAVGGIPLPHQSMGACTLGNFPMAGNINGCAYDIRVLQYMQKNTCTNCIFVKNHKK
jgi:hypothetical protein